MGLLVILLGNNVPKTAAYTTSEINSGPNALENGVATAFAWDNTCKSFMRNNTGPYSTLRQVINAGAGYADTTWLSERLQGNTASPTPVKYGAKSVPLQINSETFLCAGLVVSDEYGISPTTQPTSTAVSLSKETTRWVTASDAKDRAPNAIGSYNMRPARTNNTTHIQQLTVLSPAGGGQSISIDARSSYYLKNSRNNSSRYWRATPTNVTYTNTAGIKAFTQLKLEMKYTSIASYGAPDKTPGAVEQCISATTGNPISATYPAVLSYTNCKIYIDYLVINLSPPPVVPVTGYKIDDSKINPSTAGGAFDAVADGATDAGSYPFSDNIVKATRTGMPTKTDSSNSFLFKDCSSCAPSYDNHLEPGAYQFSATDDKGNDGTWAILGYNICDLNNPPAGGCNNTYLSKTPAVHANNASVTISAGGNYQIRFIYKQPPPDLCNNIAGIQTSIPFGMVDNGGGGCTDQPSCGSLSAPGAEDGVSFSMSINMPYNGTIVPSRPADKLSVSLTGFSNSDLGYSVVSNSIQSDPIVLTKSFGTYTVNWTFSGSDVATVSCSDTIAVGRRPYFKVYGGDIFAGGAFKTDGVCSLDDTHGAYDGKGKLLGNYNASNGGAGGELAAIAVLQVDGVASADLRTTASPTQPAGLTFANYPASPGASGGNSKFSTSGSSGYCAPDYYTELQFDATNTAKATHTNNGNPINVYTDLIDGKQRIHKPNLGNVKLSASGGSGSFDIRSTLFVDGDVFIGDNIIYSSTWNSIDTIPYLAVIVKGNIYIASTVAEIDGLYIAQQNYNPDGTLVADSGRIYTCRKASNGNSIDTTQAVTDCNQRLTVRGALIAQRIVLQRTVGSLKNAASDSKANTGNNAEVINFTPEFYLGHPVFKTNPTRPDSITSLPPIL